MKMLVCLDGSELARSILPHARQLAKTAGGQVEQIGRASCRERV